MTSRRNFLRLAGATSLALWLPKVEPVPNAYDLFLARVGRKISQIVREQQRGIHRLVIAAPENGARCCRLTLVAGPSLLDRVVFVWAEPWEDNRG